MSETFDSPEPDDELEIEISDLTDEEAVDVAKVASPAPKRISLRSQRSTRQRVTGLLATGGIVVLALAMLLGNSGSVTKVVAGILNIPTPTPTATLVPGSDLFFITGSPGWGKLTIDAGSPLAPAQSGTGQLMKLARGRHHFLWQAEPFQPIQCVLSVPTAPTDTCHLGHRYDQYGIRQVTFYETLDRLPAAQHSALVQVAQAALDAHVSTETVRPGEHFVHITASNRIDTSTRPLNATLHFRLDTHGETCSYALFDCSTRVQGQDCHLFCSLPYQFMYISSVYTHTGQFTWGWSVFAVVHANWDYTTADGQVVANNQPGTAYPFTEPGRLIQLLITRDGSEWKVDVFETGISPSTDTASSTSLGCLAADTMVAPGIFLDAHAIGIHFIAAQVPAEGCLVVSEFALRPGAAIHHVAYYLLRFGVLLAANDMATRLLPNLPRADAYEQHLAQQLAAELQ